MPDVFTDGGLTDSYRVANPDPEADPGNTWSPITSTHGNGRDEPQDRIDYVWSAYAELHVEEAHALTVGWPSEDDVADNSWASDHAAAVTTFTLGEGSTTPAPDLPVVSVDNRTIAYQVGHGPVDAAAFLGDIKATADPADATLAADLSGVDFGAPGWYTALVTATSGRYTSHPVAMTVRVAPVPGLVLSSDTATFGVGETIDEPHGPGTAGADPRRAGCRERRALGRQQPGSGPVPGHRDRDRPVGLHGHPVRDRRGRGHAGHDRPGHHHLGRAGRARRPRRLVRVRAA